MATSAIDSRFQFQLVLWYGVLAFGMLIGSMLLATNWILAGMLLAGLGFLITLPYHTPLTVVIASSTFLSALLVPLVPGRPFFWEAAAFMGWSGLLVTVLLRRFPPDLHRTLSRNRWVFVGLALFSLVALALMRYHGTGLNVLGSTSTGGRYYVQTIACAILPLVFAMARIPEEWLPRLILAQWLLTLTFLVSDFAYSFAGGPFRYVLLLLETSYDATSFERFSSRFGIRRFQSLATVGVGLTLFLLAKYRLKDVVGRRVWWLLPVFVGVFGLSLASGHRMVVFHIVGTTFVVAIVERFFTARTIILAPLFVVIGLLLTYSFADRLPLAVQRAVSFLPGIRVHNHAAADAANTLLTRRMLREAGLQMMPNHLLIGRGFRRHSDIELVRDPTGVAMFIEQGQFYNAPIGLMVNTGIPGTIGALLFFLGGTLCAVRILRYYRRAGPDDLFSRVATVLAAYWVVNAFFFLFIHGDSEMIMRHFSVHCGLLIACERALLNRIDRETEEAQAAETAPASAGA
jgi:hypothetical protein